MRKRLTITIDEKVYDGLLKILGSQEISQFIEDLIRPHVLDLDLDFAYAEMAADEEREVEAQIWVEGF